MSEYELHDDVFFDDSANLIGKCAVLLHYKLRII